MNHLVHIYADESCLGVQFTDRDSPGGAAGLVEHWDGSEWHRKDYWLSEPATTNNRMAIRSAIEGLRALRRPCRVVFTSDSQYLVNAARDWLPGWVRRGWKRKTGPVGNADLWKVLLEAWARHQVEWVWVRGHAGHPQNEYANHLATGAARRQDATGEPRPSGFLEWLAAEREKERYLDFMEWAPPPHREFRPAKKP